MDCRSSSPKLQEHSPGDTADDGNALSSTVVDVGDDDPADMQLLRESRRSETLPNAQTILLNSQTSVSFDDSESQPSRPRRSHGRPSYLECILSDGSDNESPQRASDNEDDEDELWDATDSEGESEGDIDEPEAHFESSSDNAADIEDDGSIDLEPEPTSAPRRKSQLHATSAPKQGKGIDFSLPPLDNIKDIITDLASKGLKLGLRSALRRLRGRVINVATMCSGTESPLLFLQMLNEALQALGEPSLPTMHSFSAEIDTTKQAYIERNFHPRVLFRDARQLGDEEATTATTAYGAEEYIPRVVDMLIAGFVCKDISSLNNSKKTVDDQGETGDTWRAIYYYAKRFQPSIVLLENVKSDKKLWDDVVSRWSKIGYEAAWVYCDTKNYYLPQTRERMYMIAINRRLYGKGVDQAVLEWRSTMEDLKRQCSSPYEAFLTDLPANMIAHSALSSEPDWSLCRLRYDQIRSEQQLGIRRPITQWSENGSLQ